MTPSVSIREIVAVGELGCRGGGEIPNIGVWLSCVQLSVALAGYCWKYLPVGARVVLARALRRVCIQTHYSDPHRHKEGTPLLRSPQHPARLHTGSSPEMVLRSLKTCRVL